MYPRSRITRRTVLQGMAASIALPWLEGMTSAVETGSGIIGSTAAAAGASSALASPARMAFVFIPNGVHAPDWIPAVDSLALTPSLRPLAAHRSEFTVITGLAHANADAMGDGPGDHARSAACFLTGAHPRKTAGEDIHAGVSVDQVAARAVGASTPFASLELGCEGSSRSGDCDSGYSCAYSSNISWDAPDAPRSKQIHPRHVFERLLGQRDGESSTDRARRIAQRRSVLDTVSSNTHRLKRAISHRDHDRFDDYLESVRAIERRIEMTERMRLDPSESGVSIPSEIPQDYGEYLRLMSDLLVMSFRLDLTRVGTLMYGNEGSNRSYPSLGIADGHHHLTHHGGDAAKIASVRRINEFQTESFAYLLGQLRAHREGEGTLLDSSAIVFAAAISDGDRHNHENLPVLLAGRGGGQLTPGGVLRTHERTPMCNLYLSMLETMGVQRPRFGDSTGMLQGL